MSKIKSIKKKSPPGGKRKGAGRPKGEPTEGLNLRVPKRFKKYLVKMVRDEIENLKKNENETF